MEHYRYNNGLKFQKYTWHKELIREKNVSAKNGCTNNLSFDRRKRKWKSESWAKIE